MCSVTLSFLALLLLCGSSLPEPIDCPAIEAKIQGSNLILLDADAFQGHAVARFAETGDSAVFTVTVPQDGVYDLVVSGKGIGGKKYNAVYVDGLEIGGVWSPEGVYGTDVLRKTPLRAGEHEIRIVKRWGWFYLDRVSLLPVEPIPDSVYEVTAELSNPRATEETKELYRFLQSCYGRYTLSGQYAADGLESAELREIYTLTGKHPAVLGLDMSRYTPSRLVFGSTEGDAVERAIEYHKAGGIVSFCWHWNAPANTIFQPGEGETELPWWHGYREGNSSFDLRRVMYGEDPDGMRALDMDIQGIAFQLRRLEAAGVPVLWRPLHEAAGGWFWWGGDGPDAYKQLWIYLYKTLTEVYHCNNLIWVCNCQDPAWYPGDAYVDILGDDIYAEARQYAPQVSRFVTLTEYPGRQKIAALTENGVVPDIEQCLQANVHWAWFCTWREEYVVKDGAYSEEYTEAEILKKVYDSEAVLSLEDLQRLRA